MIKHFNWQLRVDEFETESGRVAVKVKNDVITFEQIGGKAPPASLFAWANVLNVAFEQDGEPLLVRAHKAHAGRTNRYAVQHRVGMSGAEDWRLIEERNADLADFPTRAVLHISMADKFNGGFRMWIGDFFAIYEAWWKLHAHDTVGISSLMADGDALVIHEVPTRSGLEFRNAAEEYTEFRDGMAFIDALLERVAMRKDFASLYAEDA